MKYLISAMLLVIIGQGAYTTHLERKINSIMVDVNLMYNGLCKDLEREYEISK